MLDNPCHNRQCLCWTIHGNSHRLSKHILSHSCYLTMLLSLIHVLGHNQRQQQQPILFWGVLDTSDQQLKGRFPMHGTGDFVRYSVWVLGSTSMLQVVQLLKVHIHTCTHTHAHKHVYTCT